jgi:hypothetical protein
MKRILSLVILSIVVFVAAAPQATATGAIPAWIGEKIQHTLENPPSTPDEAVDLVTELALIAAAPVAYEVFTEKDAQTGSTPTFSISGFPYALQVCATYTLWQENEGPSAIALQVVGGYTFYQSGNLGYTPWIEAPIATPGYKTDPTVCTDPRDVSTDIQTLVVTGHLTVLLSGVAGY